MEFELYGKHTPSGTWLIVIIGIGLIILFASVTPEFQLGENAESVDPAAEVALAQATDILDAAKDKTLLDAFNHDSDLVIEEYRILDQRFETRFDVTILAARRGDRGTNICLTLELNVEANTLTTINELDFDECVS